MSANLSGMDPNLLPNLPGFRTRALPNPSKKHYFQLIGGQVMLKDNQTVEVKHDEPPSMIATIGFAPPKAANFTVSGVNNLILNFNAYFEQPISSAAPLVRNCNLYFYTEDATIKIVEKPQQNSGLVQGTVVRRSIINKPDGSPITDKDLVIGGTLDIYGRTLRLTNADEATKNYLKSRLGYLNQPVDPPMDLYMYNRRLLEPGGVDTWDKFRAKRNDNKTFTEARLGNTVDNSGRAGFIKYGNQTLKFRCLWDNTQNLYGDALEFALVYYLCDDSIEINSVPSSLTKESNRVKLLKRSRLPKDFHANLNLGVRASENEFFHWSDFYIGMELQVYARNLRIVDADNSTRDFYIANNAALGDPIFMPTVEVTFHEREIPPPTGFGSEEDSLRSVAGSLMPGPPPTKKYGENKTLAFFASLLSGGIDDKDRRFVITYYVSDNTVKIIEPPVRNSGFTGGTFLSRRAIKKSDGSPIGYEDLYVGCRLKVLNHEFLLLDTNDGTLRWLEDKALPRSNFYAVLDKVRPRLYEDANSGYLSQQFQELETEEGGRSKATKDALREIFNRYYLMGPGALDVCEHEILTILRANGNRSPHFNYEKFVEQVIKPTDEFK